MTPPNISFRQKSRRRFVLPVLVILLAVAGALVYIGSRGETPGKKAEEKTPQVAFTVTGFQAFSEGGPIAAAKSDPERTALVQLFTDYYQTAFVDPAKWSDPQFASLKPKFTPEAQPTFARDLTSLTIGEGRADFKRVDPSAAQLKLGIYFDKAGNPQLAVATVHFVARATTSAKRPVDVLQDATYRLQKTAAGWQIFSYQAKASQDTPSPSPSPSPSS